MVALVAFPNKELSEAKISNVPLFSTVALVALLILNIFQLCMSSESGSFGCFPKLSTFRSQNFKYAAFFHGCFSSFAKIKYFPIIHVVRKW